MDLLVIVTKQKRPAVGRQGPPRLILWVALQALSTVNQGIRAKFLEPARAVSVPPPLERAPASKCGARDQGPISQQAMAFAASPSAQAETPTATASCCLASTPSRRRFQSEPAGHPAYGHRERRAPAG